ncbi:DUF309 domain-containing protein [Rhodococcus sp. D2-41]|uniref:DUF309 domain-containing protein n=1 Tax=Speluncibacter jeojiensis TaxID=2710754 RepID=A0A9X4RDU6_9ACTN|nr:DUF309 domain-containing protein [Rhodococcus sp. D2-41]MDG3012679.1 DUF309 domain-containing protein [Rhodococcus sp. D2-41]MDG3015215.1 DUF309 domain-containing protein [Corynebacteriales bacterium D3-21]
MAGEPIRRIPRDRDASGRARNARPRDGLGRPLPYGSTGVPRQPEGVLRSPAETVDEAQRLLDGGRPFHAHEVFEDAWKATQAKRSAAESDRRDQRLWKALAQYAVGLTHCARGNPSGAAALLRRCVEGLEPLASTTPYGLDLATLVGFSRSLAGRLEAESAAPGTPVLTDPPRLRATPKTATPKTVGR